MKTIDISTWKSFSLDSLFDVVKGTRLTKHDMKEGSINYIGATAFNNGITCKIGNNSPLYPEGNLHPAGVLTVTYNGSIGETFYQEEVFWASDDVNILYPKFNMSKNIAHFFATVIKVVGRNYAYEDKWQIEDMKKSHVFLPADSKGNPDYAFMENYIKAIRENLVEPKLSILREITGEE